MNSRAASAPLTFRNSYVTEIDPTNSTNVFDGGILAIKVRASCCTPVASADLTVSQSVVPDPGLVGQSLPYSLAITNLGPGFATSLSLTDSLPPTATFVFASPGCGYPVPICVTW